MLSTNGNPVIFIMGVSGSGKTTIGQLLATRTGLPFFDADDFHSLQNKEKMQAGLALTDEDREEWLQQLNQLAMQQQQLQGCIIACSALKKKYRQLLTTTMQPVKWIYLKGSYSLIEQRLKNRTGHFMPPSLLQSQFDILEEPGDDALTIHIETNEKQAIEMIAAFISSAS